MFFFCVFAFYIPQRVSSVPLVLPSGSRSASSSFVTHYSHGLWGRSHTGASIQALRFCSSIAQPAAALLPEEAQQAAIDRERESQLFVAHAFFLKCGCGAGVIVTQDGGHDAHAWIRPWLVGATDAEFGEGRKAGRGEFGAAAFGGHGW